MVARSHICPYNGNCLLRAPLRAGRQSARWDKEASDIKKNKTAKINIIQIAYGAETSVRFRTGFLRKKKQRAIFGTSLCYN